MASRGGSLFRSALNRIGNKFRDPRTIRLGFLENSTYPDGKSVPLIAFINEYGGSPRHPAGEVTIYRKINLKTGEFQKRGKFVKRAQSNFATTHATPEYTINIPPRPFFRTMIKQEQGRWPEDMKTLLRANDFELDKSAQLMGVLMVSQLQKSIYSNIPPPNAPSTVARKGFNRTLIHTSVMVNSVASEVVYRLPSSSTS